MPVVLAASGGGHLDLLVRIRRAFDDHERIWLTAPGRRADELRAEGERVETVSPLDRTRLSPANPSRSALLALRLRPRVVVTSGAGMVLPFVQAARMLGARTLFVETMARVTSPSASGYLLAGMASESFVQWPELLAFYPWATVCRPAMLELGSGRPRSERAGTFVAVGTHHEPFDRLLALVDEAAAAGLLPEPVIAQSGASGYRPRSFEAQPWMDPAQFRERIQSARTVIGHAGSGLIAAALATGARPLVLARRRDRGEHVDDHQLQLTGKLDQLGLVVRLGERLGPDELARADRPLPDDDPFGDAPALEERVAAALERVSAPLARVA